MAKNNKIFDTLEVTKLCKFYAIVRTEGLPDFNYKIGFVGFKM